MKPAIAPLFLVVCMLAFGCAKMSAEPINYVPLQGDSASVVCPIETTMEIFPKEIHLGDTIYLVVCKENRSDSDVVVSMTDSCQENDCTLEDFSISTEPPKNNFWFAWDRSTSRSYHWIPEERLEKEVRALGSYATLKPGEKYPVRKIALEFPPLEDWNLPFWQELRAKVPEEGAVRYLGAQYDRVHINVEVLVKPRPADKTALLDEWRGSTPESLFPIVEDHRKNPNGERLESSGKSDIAINGEEYDPWLFIRLGNRKPSDPNNPTTLEGWRELEASLAPSTMRDEVRLTRLQLEYYAAEQGEPTERAQAELVDWLKSLPEIQRSVMTTTLVWKTNDLYETPLRTKNRKLIDALYDVLDRSAQERACFFRNVQDNKLEFPPLRAETVPSQPPIRKGPFITTVKPTPEDLARGVKDLPDGFRVWDATGDGGIGQVVARYAQLKEPDDVLVLQSREGASFDVTFSALSEEDKAYARAMNDSL